MRILIVEDEKDLCSSLAEGFQINGYAVDTCLDGEEAEEKIFSDDYDMIILDLNLPKLDGLEVLKRVRMENKKVNIIILTARGDIEDKVKGLDLGANDYLTKPFHFAELDARVRSLLRRKTVQEDIVISCGKLRFDTLSRSVFVGNDKISLTNKETALFEYLLFNKGCVVTSQELLEHVWDGSVDEFSNSVRMHISSLRRKLKSKLSFDPIQNIIGKGYIIKEEK
ncbi:MAG: response regulator transcription factor [Clostridium sp.]|nr:response regulator transcription factor [Clostridium sp.]MDU7082082.1 response regulator transcription factor [Clostridium sp.]